MDLEHELKVLMDIQKDRLSKPRNEDKAAIKTKEILNDIDTIEAFFLRMDVSLEERYQIGLMLAIRASDKVKAIIKKNPQLELEPLNSGLLLDLLREEASRQKVVGAI